MKKFQIIIAFVAIIGVAAFALFKTLTTKHEDNGNIEADQQKAESEISAQAKEGESQS